MSRMKAPAPAANNVAEKRKKEKTDLEKLMEELFSKLQHKYREEEILQAILQEEEPDERHVQRMKEVKEDIEELQERINQLGLILESYQEPRRIIGRGKSKGKTSY